MVTGPSWLAADARVHMVTCSREEEEEGALISAIFLTGRPQVVQGLGCGMFALEHFVSVFCECLE